jgi:predicted metal-dependent hydrolase
MNTEKRQITVKGLSVQVVRKAIKNLHLGVYPPNGRVRVAVPVRLNDDAVRLALVGKLGWIKRQRDKFESQLRQSKREMVSGESHYFLGRRYRLSVGWGTESFNMEKAYRTVCATRNQRPPTGEDFAPVVSPAFKRNDSTTRGEMAGNPGCSDR